MLVRSFPVYGCFFYCLSVVHRLLPSFPTRRSSDLSHFRLHREIDLRHGLLCLILELPQVGRLRLGEPRDRSEEHTSELQSHSDLVCRLLLEKKNGRQNDWLTITTTSQPQPSIQRTP